MDAGTWAICSLTVIPVRAKNIDTSEMVTQLLFGEVVKILETYNQWLKIEIIHDNYIGWVDNKQLIPIAEEDAKIIVQNTFRQQEDELIIHTPWGSQKVLQGSPIISKDLKFNIGQFQFKWQKQAPSLKNKTLIELAESYLNAPYLWGGRTKYGIDCSGLSQTIFHQKGYSLNRDAAQQVLQGNKIEFDQQKPGDLAFFASEKTGEIIHVGIILPHSKIIHAHGRVRIDTLDNKGIYDRERSAHSHQLSCINRLKYR